jgi:hypothetical protein
MTKSDDFREGEGKMLDTKGHWPNVLIESEKNHNMESQTSTSCFLQSF